MDQSLPDTVGHTPSPEAQERVRQLIDSGQLAEADKMCRQVLRAVPDDPEILLALARFASECGENPRASLLLEQAVSTGRASSEVHNLLCHLYRLDGWISEARAAGRAALKLPGLTASAPFNLALIHLQYHDFNEATRCLLHSLALDTDYAPAHVELGHLLLRKGEFNPGWAEYAWLFRLDHMRDVLPKFNAPEWNGMRLPKGRVLLIGDQGYGDTIQFARYIPRVQERVRDVVVGCSQEMLALISSVRGVKECFVQWADVPPFNAYCPMSSLPRIFETKLNSIPPRVPYLKIDPAKVAQWSARLTEAVGDRALRVGIAWSGRPTHPDDRKRSLKWAQLLPLTRLDGVALIALQKEIPAHDRAEFPGGIGALDLSAELGDFTDTAAVIENMDLVVTVDSSVAHLAGALAKPVWVMLPWLPDWRWLLDREDSPWYPTMRLFRQSSRGDWAGVIARVATGIEMVRAAHNIRAAGGRGEGPARPAVARRSRERKSPVAAQTLSSSKRGDAPVGSIHSDKRASERWHIMDCSLRNDVGHHLNQSLAIAAELRERKIPARFFINSTASPNLLPDAHVIPLFHGTAYDILSNDPIRGEAEDFRLFNRMTAADLGRIDASSFTRNDTVLFLSTTHNQLLGILQWAETLDFDPLPRIVVVLLYPPHHTDSAWRISTPAKRYLFAWKSCSARVRESLYLCTDSEEAARQYGSILKFRPTVLPLPIAGWDTASAESGNQLAGRRVGEILISYLGYGRHEKGFHLLPTVMRLCAVARMPVRFFVQACVVLEPSFSELVDQLATESDLQLHRGTMEPDAYYSVLAASDVTLLPYDPERYRIRASGIYFEASAMGIPVIVPADTGMGRDVAEHGNGVAFTSFTPEGVARAIADALAQVDELRVNARRYAAQLRPRRGISAYVDCILRLGIA